MSTARRTGLRALLAAALLAAAAAAHAGRPCEEQPLDTAAVTRGLELAQATERALNASGADVVLLARAGQDLSRYGLRWSHLGLAYRTTEDGQPVWRIAHKLNQCGTDQAGVFRDGLGDFFLDRPFRYEAAFVVPTPELQAPLLAALRSNAALTAQHTPRYSMVAYPWATRYQQSNQWALETLAAATGTPLGGRAAAQAWLQQAGYQPSELHIGALTRLGARVTMAHVAFDDHPNELRFADRIRTVTVDSVFAWLLASGRAGQPNVVGL